MQAFPSAPAVLVHACVAALCKRAEWNYKSEGVVMNKYTQSFTSVLTVKLNTWKSYCVEGAVLGFLALINKENMNSAVSLIVNGYITVEDNCGSRICTVMHS